MTLDLTRPLVVTHPSWVGPTTARLICDDISSAHPIAVAVTLAMGEEMIFQFDRSGKNGNAVLKNATTPREGWVVINRTQNAGCWGTYSPVYDDWSIAERVAEASGENMRVARVEWEEDAE